MRPPRSQSFSGQTPVRLDGAPYGPLAGEGRWRGVRSFEHAELCRAFGLDQASYWFDLPSTVRGIGSASGAHSSSRGVINGYVMLGGFDKPVAKLTICRDAEKFKDVDPMNERDFLDLSHS